MANLGLFSFIFPILLAAPLTNRQLCPPDHSKARDAAGMGSNIGLIIRHALGVAAFRLPSGGCIIVSLSEGARGTAEIYFWPFFFSTQSEPSSSFFLLIKSTIFSPSNFK